MSKTAITSAEHTTSDELSPDARVQDERAYTEGPVIDVHYLRVEYGKFEEYVDWLNSTWKPYHTTTKNAGLIIDYKVFRATPKSADQPNVILMITFKNMAALDEGIRAMGR